MADADRDVAEADASEDAARSGRPAADSARREPAAAGDGTTGESGDSGDTTDADEAATTGESSASPEADPAPEGSGERKAYEFGDGPAPVHTGDQRAVSPVVRPIRSPSSDEKSKGTGDDAPATSPVRALRVVQDLSLDRLLGADPETREARNAKLRRVGTGVGAVALAGVLVYAVFPVRTALDQRAAIDRSREQSEMLRRANDRLEDRAESLRTDEEIERLAREQYGLVKPGEESYGVLPPPESTTTTTTSTTTPPAPGG